MGPHTSSTAAVLDGLRRIVQALRESSRRAEREVGLTGAQLFVLRKLAESPAASLNQLAARTQTHQSSVSTVVSRLVGSGLVERRRHPSDARRVELALSATGRRVVRRAPDTAQDALIRSIERLPAARRRLLASSLEELVRGMDASRVRPAMFFNDGMNPNRATRRRRRHA